MNKFELTIIFPEECNDTEREKVEQIIKSFSQITKVEDDGVKRLAYPIIARGREQARGRFVCYYLSMPRENAAKLSGALNINDMVMRYLLIKTDIQH